MDSQMVHGIKWKCIYYVNELWFGYHIICPFSVGIEFLIEISLDIKADNKELEPFRYETKKYNY